MQLNPLFHSSPVQFNGIRPEIAGILDEYCYSQIANIPKALRPILINKFHITARSFIILFRRKYLDKKKETISRDDRNFRKLSNLYETLQSLIKPTARSLQGSGDFRLRCKVLSELMHVPEKTLEDHMREMPHNYHLFGCLNEIIFIWLKLSKTKREILNHQSGYSNKYEKLSKAEIARKLSISKSAVSSQADVLMRRVDDTIKRFKLIGNYCSYEAKYKLNGGPVKVTAEMCSCIKREEGADGITPCFIAKVFGILFNYRVACVDMGKEEYYLVRRNGSKKSNFGKLFRKLGKVINGVRKEAGEEDFRLMLRCFVNRSFEQEK
jgi:hypothetical protein